MATYDPTKLYEKGMTIQATDAATIRASAEFKAWMKKNGYTSQRDAQIATGANAVSNPSDVAAFLEERSNATRASETAGQAALRHKMGKVPSVFRPYAEQSKFRFDRKASRLGGSRGSTPPGGAVPPGGSAVPPSDHPSSAIQPPPGAGTPGVQVTATVPHVTESIPDIIAREAANPLPPMGDRVIRNPSPSAGATSTPSPVAPVEATSSGVSVTSGGGSRTIGNPSPTVSPAPTVSPTPTRLGGGTTSRTGGNVRYIPETAPSTSPLSTTPTTEEGAGAVAPFSFGVLPVSSISKLLSSLASRATLASRSRLTGGVR